jgi:hypothetical protein
LTIDYPLIGRMSWMVTCKPHLSDSGEVLGVSTASIDITEKVEVSKRLSKMHAQMVQGKATEGELRRTVQLTGVASDVSLLLFTSFVLVSSAVSSTGFLYIVLLAS